MSKRSNESNDPTGSFNGHGPCLAIDDGFSSNNSISCCYLRCAAEVVARTESNDCVRVYHFDTGSAHQSASLSASAELTSSATTADASAQNTPTYDSPSLVYPHGDDRLQRRKEKKRRKKEIRMQLKEGDTHLIQSLRVTTTIFHPVFVSRTQNQSIKNMSTSVPLSIPHPRSIVHVKPLIVLDLNGILCHRVRLTNHPTTVSTSTIFRPSCGKISNTDVIPRSDLHDFLALLHENFCLAVWTSATRKTAKLLVQALFPQDVRERLIFVWHRNFCNLVPKPPGISGVSAHGYRRYTSRDAIPIPSESLSIIDGLLASRLNARNYRSFDEADNIQNTLLNVHGVRVRDSDRTWSTVREKNDSSGDKSCNLDGCSATTADRLGITAAESTDNHESKTSPNNATIHDDLTAIKSLSKVWSAYPLWDSTNTILLDDSPEKCPHRFRGNALHPLPISGTVTACVDEIRNDQLETQAIDGGVKGADDDPKPEESSYSIVDDDEANQEMQRSFFRLLASYWEHSASPPTQNLMEFLEKHANSHNMRWEIGSSK